MAKDLCCYSFFTDPPNITYITLDETVNETDTVTLNCTADGKPTPNITWTSPRGSKISFEPSFTFSITSKLDEGIYNCTADNGVGTAVFATVNITVESEWLLCICLVMKCTQVRNRFISTGIIFYYYLQEGPSSVL